MHTERDEKIQEHTRRKIADVTVDGEYLGQIAEAVVDVKLPGIPNFRR